MDSVRALLAATRVADPLERDEVLDRVTQGLFGRSAPPRSLGRYRVLERLGGGGQGVVYAAHDPELGRRVAIKVLRVGTPSEDATQRLRREAMALARLSDPHVIAVNDVGICPAGVFVVMQLVPGRTLSEWLATPRSWQAIVGVFSGAGRGLVAAHGQGIIHRDFKPANVWIGEDGIPRLLDFGLAQLGAPAPATPSGEDTLEQSSRLTALGHVMGTPPYMAPEQHDGEPLTPATDQYAYCVTLHEALYGARPWDAPTLERLVAAKRMAVLPRPPKGSQVPARVRHVVRRGLSPDPDARWPSMAALVDALSAAGSSRGRSRAVYVGGGLLALALAGVAWAGDDRAAACEGEQVLATVWSDSRRAAIANAFAQTSIPFASDAAGRVGRDLDAFAQVWIATRDRACAELEVDPRADARMRCLEDVRAQLEDTLGILEGAGAGAVEHADELVRDLPDPSACASPETWAPAVEDRDIHREIARARALGLAGHTRVAVETARRALDDAEVTHDDGLRAEAGLVYGGVLLESGDIDAASTELERAYLRATATGRDRIAFDAAIVLTGIFASHRQDLEACRLWVERAAVTLDRDDGRDDPALRGRLALARAKRGFSAGDYAEAVVHARDAVTRLDDAGDPAVSAAANILAQLLSNVGRHEEARAEVERGIEIAERLRGAEHPATAAALKTLGAMQASSGETDEAFATFGRALAIYRAIHGDDDLRVAEIRRHIANTHAISGNNEEAARGYREVLAIQRRHLPEGDSKIAQTLYNLSLAVRALGDLAQAEALGREAVGIAEASIGGDHPTTAIYLHGLGQTLVGTDPAAAIEALARGREIAGRVVGQDHSLYAAFLTTLAEAELGLGDPQAARALLEQSLAIHDGPARGADPKAHEETRSALARLDERHPKDETP